MDGKSLPQKCDPDPKYAREFREKPLGHHSAGLSRILTLFRGEAMEGKFVLVCTKPHEEWMIGRLTGKRGDGVDLLEQTRYSNRADAEFRVFELRWKKYFGEELKL